MSGDASGGERLNLPPIPLSLQIPESSDEKQARKIASTSEFVSSLNSMVKKELSDLSKSLPGGNLGNFKLIDGAGGDITEIEKGTKRPHKKRSLPSSGEAVVAKKKTRTKRTPGLQRKTWDQRAACVFAYLHPKIGHKDYQLTSDLCRVSANTLRGWTSKALLIAKWVPFLDRMTAADVAKVIDLDIACLGVDPKDQVDASDFKEILARKKLTPVIIKEGKKRVQSRPRVSKWHPQFLFVKKILDEHWENNRPVTLKLVRDQLQAAFHIPNTHLPVPESLKITDLPTPDEEKQTSNAQKTMKKFSDRYLSIDGKSFPTLVNTFITRAINRSGYSLRDRFLRRLLPFDWKDEFPKFSQQFLNLCNEIEAQSVVAINPIFISTVMHAEIVPNDVHYDASGLVALMAVRIPDGQLLKPLLIKPGKKTGEVQVKSEVVIAYEEKGNINQSIVAQFLQSIHDQQAGKRTVIVLSKSSKHVGDAISAFTANNGKVKLFYIPHTLNSIANVVPTYLSYELESRLKSSFDTEVDQTSILSSDQLCNDRVRGLGYVYHNLQSDSNFKDVVTRSFNKCGLNPFVAQEVLNYDRNVAIKDISQVEESYIKLEKNVQQIPKPHEALQLKLP